MVWPDHGIAMTDLNSEEEHLIGVNKKTVSAAITPGKEPSGAFSGWRFGVINCASWVVLVLLVNLTVTIVVGTRYGYTDGLGVLFDGSCDAVRKYNVVGHLIINILSTILLSGSNYCMQCLSAPTRQEVDRAHSKRVALDIGIPSMKNLGYISRKRLIAWVLLACSSLPLHLLYVSSTHAAKLFG